MGPRLSVILALLVTAAMVGIGVMSFHDGTAKTRPMVPPFDLFWCEADSDCVVVDRIGCCGCAESGGQAAVTSWHVDDLRRFLKGACREPQVCVQVDACREGVVARCRKRQCVLVNP